VVLVHLESVEIEDLQFFTTSMTFISFGVLILPSVTYICCTSHKIIYNYSMLIRSIQDLSFWSRITISTWGRSPRSILLFLISAIKSCLDRKQHATIALLFFQLSHPIKYCMMLYLFDDLWLDKIIPKNNDRTKKAEPYMEILRIRLIRFTG
jgi:hypothetical protein